jgi:uncharacterized protein
MKRLNAESMKGRKGIRADGRLDRPRVFRLAGRRISFDPDSLEACLLEDGEPPPEASLECPSFPAQPNRHPRAICLSLTRECNLACTYCYVRNGVGRRAPERMTKETVTRALDLFGQPTGRLQVSFFGGEPVMAWGLVKWGVERATAVARAAGLREPPHFHLTTNGTLLTDDRLDFLAEHGFSMIVSIDGPEVLHDRHRRFTQSAGSYGKVVDALHRVADRPRLAAHTTLRSTFLPGQAEMAARLEELNDLCDLGCAHAVSVEPAVVSESTCPIESGEFAPGELARAILEGARWCVDRARGGKQARFHLLTVTLRRLLRRQPAPTECGAGWGYAAVAPSGEVFACHKEAGRSIGHVRYGFDEEARTPWRENRWYGRPKCRRCWARNLCGGGCRAQALCHTIPARVSCEIGRARSVAAIEALASLAGEPEVLARLVPAGKGKQCASDS